MVLILKLILLLMMIGISYGAWSSYKDFSFFLKSAEFDELPLRQKLKFKLSIYSGIFGVIVTDIVLLVLILSPIKIQ